MEIVAVLISLYFLPSLIAIIKGRRNKTAIFALNILLGWTFIGWVVSLVWSLTYNPNKQN